MGKKTKKIKPVEKNIQKPCDNCNPKKHLKFNFTFMKENGSPAQQDGIKLVNRLKEISSDIYEIMLYQYQGNKKSFIENIPIALLNKQIPTGFRDLYPPQTNEQFAVFRIYPAGVPSGSANPRVIGMIKNTIFYIFFIDWKGNLYKHN